MTRQMRTPLIASLMLGFCVAVAHGQVVTPTNDPADTFSMKQVGNGEIEIDRKDHQPVRMNLAMKQDKDSISVQVKNPHSNDGGFFNYHERERRIDFGGNGKQFVAQIHDNGTVSIGNTVCDGRKDQACIATALANALNGLPVEGVMAMLASLDNVLQAPGTPLGREIRQTFRDLVHDDVVREKRSPRVR